MSPKKTISRQDVLKGVISEPNIVDQNIVNKQLKTLEFPDNKIDEVK